MMQERVFQQNLSIKKLARPWNCLISAYLVLISGVREPLIHKFRITTLLSQDTISTKPASQLILFNKRKSIILTVFYFTTIGFYLHNNVMTTHSTAKIKINALLKRHQTHLETPIGHYELNPKHKCLYQQELNTQNTT